MSDETADAPGGGGILSTDARALLEAVTAISSDLDLHNVLNRIVEAATSLTSARFGALGVVGPENRLIEFLTTGVDADLRSRIGELPHGRGILGLLISDPRPLRLKDLTHHPASYGFPPNHPPMGSFLGVPVRIRGNVFGNLYLTEKAGGGEFTESDEELCVGLAGAAGVLIENARAYGLSERRRRWLEAMSALPDTIQPPIDWSRSLHRVCEIGRRASGSEALAILDPTSARVLAVACDPEREPAIRQSLAEVAPTIRELEITDPADVPMGERVGTVVPLATRLAEGGVLVSLEPVGDRHRRDHDDRDFLRSFTDYAALTLDRGEAMTQREALAVVSDRERIARDLHDVVIQRLFATGMQLRAAAMRVEDAELRDRVESSVGDLDATIRDVRATIFELQTPSSGSVRAEVRELVREYREVLGFSPRLTIKGPLDTAVTETMREPLMKVLREALSNVARHARATQVEISLSVSEGTVTLSVDDDGVGLPADVSRSGLENARVRAAALGGTLHLDVSPLSGVRLQWSIPLRAE